MKEYLDQDIELGSLPYQLLLKSSMFEEKVKQDHSSMRDAIDSVQEAVSSMQAEYVKQMKELGTTVGELQYTVVGAIERIDVLEEAAQDIAVELQEMKDEQERKNEEQDGRIKMLEDMNVEELKEEHAKQAEKIGHLETVTKELLDLIKELKGGREEAIAVAANAI